MVERIFLQQLHRFLPYSLSARLVGYIQSDGGFPIARVKIEKVYAT